MIDWRKIEVALVQHIDEGYAEESAKSGDKFLMISHPGDPLSAPTEINLTNLAKAIADDLNGG